MEYSHPPQVRRVKNIQKADSLGFKDGSLQPRTLTIKYS